MEFHKKISAFTIIVAFVVVALMGVALIPILPIKLSPSKTLPSLTVSFSMPGSAPRIVEIKATSKLEAMLARIKGIKNISSTSGTGWGHVILELDKRAPIEVVRFEASTIVRQTWQHLPREMSYPMISVSHPDEKASSPFMTFTISAPDNPFVIQKYAEKVCKQKLSDLEGLYKIEVKGANPMEWQLTYDSDQLDVMGITINDIREAISLHYTSTFLGIAETQGKKGATSRMRVMLASDGEKNKLDASNIILKSKHGGLIRLDRLVKVDHTEQEPTSYYRINGLNSVYISLTAKETANQLELSENVYEVMDNVRSSLPPRYEIHSIYDATAYIHAELKKIYLRSGLTILILLSFVLLITRSVRYLFMIVASLSINLAIAVIFYYLFRLEIQLYSLAGITISLSLIIDSTILMADHLMRRQNRHVFMPILAATMTTIGALSIIFFLDEKIRLNLQDFAFIIMINLAVSLAVSLFFVPAMVEKMNIKNRKPKTLKRLLFRPLRLVVYYNRLYAYIIQLLLHRKWVPLIAIILLFGLPTFLVPDKIEEGTAFAKNYNAIFDSYTYKEKVKPTINKVLGGTLRLFVEDVFQDSYFTRNEEMVLTITASMPNGTTLMQMNTLIEKMEHYLSKFKGIEQFQTHINNARRAYIQIFFSMRAQKGVFPYQLKSDIISKALKLGGGSWSVYGLPQDQGFSNNVEEPSGHYAVKIRGYNYDELYTWADTLKARLLKHRRIKEVNINSEYSWYKDDYRAFFFNINKQSLANKGLVPNKWFASVQQTFNQESWAGSVVVDGEKEDVKLKSKQAKLYDIWMLNHIGNNTAKQFYKLNALATVSKAQSPQEVGKENQQYRLVVQYDYIGTNTQGEKILEQEIEALNKQLPMGYTAKNQYMSWGTKDYKQYWLIGLLIAIVFFTTTILFNSIWQPLAVIFVIPISFIGVFLTFYGFDINFDQGGFASLVLLSGIAVNSGIYILNEYNRIRKNWPLMPLKKAYLKAWNAKIVPIFLTMVSTILGFVPFMIGEDKEAFWFPLASGTIGGLIMSFVGIWLFLPLMTLRKTNK